MRNGKTAIKKGTILLWLCWLVYTTAYLGRSSYNANINAVIDWYRITNAAAGFAGSFFFFAYGCGQVFHGCFCRYYPKRYIITVSLSICAIVNLIFFVRPAFGIFKYLMLINGIVLSMLWPSLIYILSNFAEDVSQDYITLVMSTPSLVGTFINYLFSALVNKFGIFEYTFLFASIACVIVAILWFISAPSLMGNRQTANTPAGKKETHSAGMSLSAFMISFFVIVGLMSAAGNFIKDGLINWAPKILKDQFVISNSLSILLSLVIPIFGFLGTLVLIGGKKLIKNEFTLSGALFAVMAGASAIMLRVAASGNISAAFMLIFILFMGIVICFANALNTLVTATMPLRFKERAGIACGINNGCCYVGTTLSSYTLGAISDRGGWSAVFTLLIAAGGIACIVLLIASRIFKNSETP